jgi:hypothetical protein
VAVLAVVALGALGLLGCSDDDSSAADEDRPTTPSTTTAPAATTGPCPYVSTETVAEAFGLTVELADGQEHSCDFIIGGTATLLISGDLPDGECDPGTQVEAESGDSACLVDGVPTAIVVTNEYAVGLKVTGQVAAPETRDALVRLLPDVTPEG